MNGKKQSISPKEFTDFSDKLSKLGVNTICDSGLCINRPECFKARKIAFLVMGNICTRNCRYCGVTKGIPTKLDKDEPGKVANAVKELNLKYVVLTSVTRDDLPDQGANHFKQIVDEVKRQNSNIKVELLIPDFWGKEDLLSIIISSRPEVINHNIECTRNRFKILRPRGNYDVSLDVLKKTKIINSKMTTKSGFMVGVGESFDDIKKTIIDLKNNSVDIITIGQYLPPHKMSFKLGNVYTEDEFAKMEKFAKGLKCFKKIFIGPNVRSSYHAEEQLEN